MNKKILIMLTATILSLGATKSIAEEGKRFDSSVTWKNVVKIDYKPGKRGDALKIIKDYYMPATKKAGTEGPELVFELQTGDYDLLVVWHMSGGITDMTWEDHPDDAKWIAALNEVAGSEEKAKEIMAKYLSYVEHAENDIALVR